ncbi:MAG: bifunctional (p)ppGpp synthetase/guanosine-3',5'-bis(diphosphate) 3'-pyrophosphohydrolase [Clostridia bacterium]|nr:bifunctional (p)ppGpp synthetase/guanosine-3',5'-bis(diphosphate) 3'-pyrophosphohydrolase [Clostridia bacterium]
MSLEQMTARLLHFHPSADTALVERAYAFAEEKHGGQRRLSGEPYIIHPVYVASILTEIGIDAPTIAAGLLHDTVEDCEGVTLEVIREQFGEEVAILVDGVTKLSKLDFTDREERQAETLRKMILAMGKDIRVVLIKLADRLHNMRTLKFQPQDRQAAIARETLDIYAPLAHRLGVYRIKAELEDLSLRYIDPEGYRDVAQKVGMKRVEREEQIKIVIDELTQKLKSLGMHFEVAGRPKHLYSIYRKMVLQNRPFDQIYDLIAIRVLVDTIPDCYTVLGVCHTLWNQVPGRFKDYISVPKNNMYQSLHTTVIGGRRIPFPFEVQIRTWEMHHVAEYGIAAHWRYKEGGNDQSFDTKLHWLRQILDWQSETRDSHEFIDGLKTDLFAEQVFIFTPKGDIIDLPRGATPLDFAYRVHSAVGNSCIGAKVNGRIVPLGTPLETGDRVEIMTSPSAKGPSLDWLKVVKTQGARAKIRQYFRRELRGENVQRGREMVEHEAKRRGVQLGQLLRRELCEPLLRKYDFDDMDDIFGAVGYGMIASAYVVSRLVEEQRKADEAAAPPAPAIPTAPSPAATASKPTQGIFVEGGSGMLVRFAKCCNPVPGDDIVGYITRGRGVTVHKADCVNAQYVEPERKVNVSWAQEGAGRFDTSIHIIAYDRPSLLGDLTVSVQDFGVPITALTIKVNKNKTCTIHMVVQVESREKLDQVLRRLQKRADVIEAFRTGG